MKCRFPRETGRSQAPRRQQEVSAGSSFDDVMLYVGIEVADVYADNRYVDVSITVEHCVDDVDFTVREEDATSFELVATPRIDVAAGSSRGMRGRAAIPHSHLPAGIVSHHEPSG
ncbi:hypothetical protein F511_40716 [Dorcoceras hygrometricum]|uniref:Uncharacterized protein n=1 Tax=Dorcoceras hygrometricum TaxID=472368 RepID=A0A2Z7BX51_9LAMI|nr:hypothetical protein F511_40716 [Dorcoceras hygrometricum]